MKRCKQLLLRFGMDTRTVDTLISKGVQRTNYYNETQTVV